jgi:hypothetical protein
MQPPINDKFDNDSIFNGDHEEEGSSDNFEIGSDGRIYSNNVVDLPNVGNDKDMLLTPVKLHVEHTSLSGGFEGRHSGSLGGLRPGRSG